MEFHGTRPKPPQLLEGEMMNTEHRRNERKIIWRRKNCCKFQTRGGGVVTGQCCLLERRKIESEQMIFQKDLGQPITHPFQTHPLLEVFSVSNCRLAEKSAENAARRYLKVHTQRCPYLCDREGGGAQEEAALVAHILALVSSDARRRGATLHMLVPFCVDVQQHSISTHQPQ